MRMTVDLLDGNYSETMHPTDGYLIARATRFAMVYGISGESTAERALIDATAVVRAAHPIGRAYSGERPLCKVVGYGAAGVAEDSDAVRIQIYYDTRELGAPQTGQRSPFTVTDDTEVTMGSTQLDPFSGDELVVKFKHPRDNSIITPPRIATLSSPLPVRSLIISGVIPARDLSPFQRAIGSVNYGDWGGEGPKGPYKQGWWLFWALRSQTSIGANWYHVVCELRCQQREDWSSYYIMTLPDTGNFVPLAPGLAQALRNEEYRAGARAYNGIIKAGLYPLEDFGRLFGFTNPSQLVNY